MTVIFSTDTPSDQSSSLKLGSNGRPVGDNDGTSFLTVWKDKEGDGVFFDAASTAAPTLRPLFLLRLGDDDAFRFLLTPAPADELEGSLASLVMFASSSLTLGFIGRAGRLVIPVTRSK